MKQKKLGKMIYLDHAAATPLRSEVLDTMLPYLQSEFGNPSSITKGGTTARAAVEDARTRIAAILGCHTDELIFTSGGTESINLALRGLLGVRAKGHLIVSAIEHHAVLETVRALEAIGFLLSIIPVKSTGEIDLTALTAAIRPNTHLVSVMLANNELGTIQPLEALGREIARINRRRRADGLLPILFHTDACQAPAYVSVDVNRYRVDALSLNAAKIGGPKGVGLLYVRRQTPLVPQLTGGGHEASRRAGTENVAGIVGLARALVLADLQRDKESVRQVRLRDRLFKGLAASHPDLVLHGGQNRLPNNLSIGVPGVDAEALVLYLDQDGVTVGAGAACSHITLEPSHVLRAIGCSDELALSTIRITLGRETTAHDITRAIRVITNRISWYREHISSVL